MHCETIVYSGFEKDRELYISPKTDSLILEISKLTHSRTKLRLSANSELKVLTLFGDVVSMDLLKDLKKIEGFNTLELGYNFKINIYSRKIKRLKLPYEIKLLPCTIQ